MWYLVIKESKTETCQLSLQQPNQPLSTSQTKCESHTKTSWNICTTCPFRARAQTLARNFPETKMILVHTSIRRVQHNVEPLPSSVSRALCCPHTITSTFLPLTCPQDDQWGFWGGGVRITQSPCKGKPYWYLIRTCQAQQVWAKRVIMV